MWFIHCIIFSLLLICFVGIIFVKSVAEPIDSDPHKTNPGSRRGYKLKRVMNLTILFNYNFYIAKDGLNQTE